MMSRIFLLTALISFKVLAVEVPEYKAKYQFDSEEISITGIREFTKNENGYELKFKASNIVASMYFSSLFDIEDNQIKSSKYNIKIRPKFLKRDQRVNFDYKTSMVSSVGRNEWQNKFELNKATVDPLNAQIMIRGNIKNGMNSFSLNLLNMRNGDIEKYDYVVTDRIKCSFNASEYNCIVLERIREGSSRKTTYFLAEELGFMFIKITDESDNGKSTLELKEILSFG